MQYIINSVGKQNITCYTFSSPTTAYIQGVFINSVGANLGNPIGFTATPTTKSLTSAYRTATSNSTAVLPFTYKTFHFSVTGTVSLGFGGLRTGGMITTTTPSVSITNGVYKIGLDITPTSPVYATVSSSSYTLTHVSSSGPLDNPLKGGFRFVSNSTIPSTTFIPITMGFRYITWTQISSAEGSYNWDIIDSLTTGIRNPVYADKRVVLRLVLNYPGQTRGVPQWVIDKGVTVYTISPSGASQEWEYDYNNRALVDNLKILIAEFGRKYNSNPQIAGIQVGIFGQWGEGTTYRLKNSVPSASGLMYSIATQTEIATALKAAFPNKPLMARVSAIVNFDPTSISFASSSNLQLAWMDGFHDDMLFSQTDSLMLKSLRAGGKLDNWKIAPNSGETGYGSGSLCILASAYTDIIVHSASGNVITSALQPITRFWGGYSNWRTVGGSGFTIQNFYAAPVNRTDGWVVCDRVIGTPGASGGVIRLYNTTTGEYFNSINEYVLENIRRFHLTYAGVYLHELIASMAPWQIENYKNIIRTMGYQYRILSTTLTQNPPQLNTQTNYFINLVNEGSAPFYEKWPVRLFVEHTTNSSYNRTYTVPTDITKWLPGYFKLRVPITFPIAGTYKLYLGVWDSWLGRPNIKFANANTISNGWTLLQTVVI